MEGFITYDRLSANDSVHQISSAKPSVLYTHLNNFIARFTNADNFDSAHLVFPSKRLLDSLKYLRVFGVPRFDFYDSLGTGKSSVFFAVKQINIEKALELLDKIPDGIISIKWKFKFIDPISKKPLENQESIPVIDERVSNSQIYACLSINKSTISPWFAFPFSDLNEKSLHYIDDLKNHLPFKLSDKSWKRWSLSRNGSWTPRYINSS